MKWDVAIVGGGPAGLACAIACAQQGLSTVLLERRTLPCDKACGEGLLPAGVKSLKALGTASLLDVQHGIPLRGIRYIQEDGTSAEARFLNGPGLGVSRLKLSQALVERAAQAGVTLRERSALRHHTRDRRRVQLTTDLETFEADCLIAADGLHSPLRHTEGLQGPSGPLRRYGVRYRVPIRPWSDFVEIHLSDGAEAYVTPVGCDQVGVAILWAKDGRGSGQSKALVTCFPQLGHRLDNIQMESRPLGAGPFLQRANRVALNRFALLGDAAGYIDALTGEGLSLAFHCALTLATLLPHALRTGVTQKSLEPYEQTHRRLFRRYAAWTRLMLALTTRAPMRRGVVRLLHASPRLFERLVDWGTGGQQRL